MMTQSSSSSSTTTTITQKLYVNLSVRLKLMFFYYDKASQSTAAASDTEYRTVVEINVFCIAVC
jgi:hypothetical protein